MSQFNYYLAVSEIQSSYSIKELESICTKNLKHQMNVESVKISVSKTQQKKDTNKIQATVCYSYKIDDQQKLICEIYRNKKFNITEKKFLDKISKQIAICCSKILKYEQLSDLRNQWDTTFDAVSTPLCMTDEKFNIKQTNKLFLQTLDKDSKQVNGKNIFKTFFGSKDVSFKIEKGSNSFSTTLNKSIKGRQRIYEVQCQLIDHKKNNILFSNKQYLIVFRDITENKKLKTQIFNSAKFAELGTIASSIAHELNNPLAGMLAFIQLINKDLPRDSNHIDNIKAIETATLECKTIVENLLGFSRKIDKNEITQINLTQIIKKAIATQQLKIVTAGVEINFSNTQLHQKVFIRGHKGLLTQAFSHIIQYSANELMQHKKSNKNFKPQLNITLNTDLQRETSFTLTSNRTAMNSHSLANTPNNLGLTIAYKILKDHNFKVEFYSQPNIGVQAKLSFERLDLLDERQVFDAKI